MMLETKCIHGIFHSQCVHCAYISGREAGLEEAAEFIHRFRLEANDHGLEAYPDGTWELCEQLEQAIRGLRNYNRAKKDEDKETKDEQ